MKKNQASSDLKVTDIRRAKGAEREPTVYVGMRLKKSFYERLLAVAEKQCNNVRGVVEQFDSTTLPELEKIYHTRPEEGAEKENAPAKKTGR